MKQKGQKTGVPVSPSFSVPGTPASFAGIEDHRIDNCSFQQEVSDRDLSFHEFYECTFTGISFTGRCSGDLFADAVFDHCDFSNADFEETVVRRAVFRGCRMTGTNFMRSTMEDAVFDGCTCSYANFSGSRFKRCGFHETQYRESSFSSCRFNMVRFQECDFTAAEFLDTKLMGLDFSDSRIDGILVTGDNLKGVTVNEEQALAFAKLLGIRIR